MAARTEDDVLTLVVYIDREYRTPTRIQTSPNERVEDFLRAHQPDEQSQWNLFWMGRKLDRTLTFAEHGMLKSIPKVRDTPVFMWRTIDRTTEVHGWQPPTADLWCAARMSAEAVIDFFTFEDILREWILPRLPRADQIALASTNARVRQALLHILYPRGVTSVRVATQALPDAWGFCDMADLVPPASSPVFTRALDSIMARSPNLQWICLEQYPAMLINNDLLRRIGASCPALVGLRLGCEQAANIDESLPVMIVLPPHHVTDDAVVGLVRKCPRLRVLSLVRCVWLTPACAETISGIPNAEMFIEHAGMPEFDVRRLWKQRFEVLLVQLWKAGDDRRRMRRLQELEQQFKIELDRRHYPPPDFEMFGVSFKSPNLKQDYWIETSSDELVADVRARLELLSGLGTLRLVGRVPIAPGEPDQFGGGLKGQVMNDERRIGEYSRYNEGHYLFMQRHRLHGG